MNLGGGIEDLKPPQQERAFDGREWIRSIAVTADGARAVSGGNDGIVRLWDLATGRELARLSGHVGLVNSVAVTADGSRAVSGGDDGTVRVWDLPARRELAKLSGHTGPVRGVAIIADGSRAVSGGDDGTVRVWDLAAGRELAKFAGHAGPVRGVAVAADGSRIVSGGDDRTVRVWAWDLVTSGELARLTGHTDLVQAVAVTADGNRAVSGGSDGTVRLWDLATGRELAEFTGHGSPVRGVAVTADGAQAVSGGTDRSVRVWDLVTSHELACFTGHSGSVRGMAVTGDGSRAVSGGSDGVVRVWDLAASDRDKPPAASRPAEGRDRTSENFKNGYLTLVAIIQGVAFAALVAVAFNAASAGLSLAHAFTLATEAFATLFAIVAVTDEYLQLLRAVEWNPGSVDTAIPYALGSGEVVAALSLGKLTLWWAATSVTLIMAAGAFRYSKRRAMDTILEGYANVANIRRFVGVVARLSRTCEIMFFYALAICLLSAFATLSPWIYAFAPLVLLFGLLAVALFLPGVPEKAGKGVVLFKAAPRRSALDQIIRTGQERRPRD
jgi:WD40 repeat protein